MKVNESNNSTNKKLVSFNMHDRSNDKIDKLTSVMSKLTAKVEKQDTL